MANHPEDDLPGRDSPQQPHENIGKTPPPRPPTPDDADETIDLGAPPPNPSEPSGFSGDWAALVDEGPVSEVLQRPETLHESASPSPGRTAPPTSLASGAALEPGRTAPTTSLAGGGAMEVARTAAPTSLAGGGAMEVARTAPPTSLATGEPMEVARTAPPTSLATGEPMEVAHTAPPTDFAPGEPLELGRTTPPTDFASEEAPEVGRTSRPTDFATGEALEPGRTATPTEFATGEAMEVEDLATIEESAEAVEVQEIDEVDEVEEMPETAVVEESPDAARRAKLAALIESDVVEPFDEVEVLDEPIDVVAEGSGVDLSGVLPDTQGSGSGSGVEQIFEGSGSGVDLGASELIAAESASNILDKAPTGYDPTAAPIDSGVNLGSTGSFEVSLSDVELPPVGEEDLRPVYDNDPLAPPSSTVDLGGRRESLESDSTRSRPSDADLEDVGFAVRGGHAGDIPDATSPFPETPGAGRSDSELTEEAVVEEDAVEAAAEEDVFETHGTGMHAAARAEDSSSEEAFDGDLTGTETIDDLDAQRRPSAARKARALQGPLGEDDVDQPVEEEAVAEEEIPVRPPARPREPAVPATPPTPARAAPSRFAWFGGGVLVTSLLAIVGVAALAAIKPEPVKKLFGASATATTTVQPALSGQTTASLPPDLQKAFDSKDPDQVRQAYERQLAQETRESTEPRDLVRKSQLFAQEAFQKKPTEALDLSGDEAKQLIAGLEAVKDKDANAALRLGLLYEASGKLPEALKEYQAGDKTFANNRTFKDGIRRVNRKLTAPVDMNGQAPAARPRAVELALLLVLLRQEPQEPQVQEAGSFFLEALEQAETGDFKAAVASLNKSQDLHRKNRRLNPGKAQNPGSDPDEEIFLFSCDLLRNYYGLQQQLADAKLLELPKDMPANAARVKKVADLTREALTRSISEAQAGKKSAEALAKALGAKPDDKQLEDAGAALAAIVKAKKETDGSLAAVAERLAKESADLAGTREKLEGVVARLDKAKRIEDKDKPAEAVGKLLDDLTAAETEAKKQIELAATAKKVSDDLVKVFVPKVIPADKQDDATFVKNKLGALVAAYDASTEKLNLEKLVTDVGRLNGDLTKANKQVALLQEQFKSLTEGIAKLTAELNSAREKEAKAALALANLEKQKLAFEERIKTLRSVEQVLPIWAAALRDSDAATGNPLAAQALADADQALKDKDPKAEGLALLVRGLALMAQNKFDEARAALTDAKGKLAGDPVYLPQVTALLGQLEDPTKPLLDRVARLERWPGVEVLHLLTAAEKNVADPKKKAMLQAERSLLLLERAQLAPDAADADKPLAQRKDIQEARAEAHAAAQADVARGHYALGRIQEVVDPFNNVREILAHYRKAIDLASDPGEKALYRSAWARVQVLPQLPGRAPEEKKPNDKDARLDRDESRRLVARLLVLLTFGPVEEQKSREEAKALIQELEPLPIDTLTPPQLAALAEAYRLNGQFDRSYDTYLRLVRAKVGPEGIAGLRRLQKDLFPGDRPVFQEPRVAEGEFFYTQGVREFFAGNYDLALKALDAAIAADNTDARYY